MGQALNAGWDLTSRSKAFILHRTAASLVHQPKPDGPLSTQFRAFGPRPESCCFMDSRPSAACAKAKREAQYLASVSLKERGHLILDHYIRVTDELGDVVGTVTFEDAVKVGSGGF